MMSEIELKQSYYYYIIVFLVLFLNGRVSFIQMAARCLVAQKLNVIWIYCGFWAIRLQIKNRNLILSGWKSQKITK